MITKYQHILLVFLCAIHLSCVAQKKEVKDLKINEIQVLGTHNSYAQPIDPKVISYSGPIIDRLKTDYMKNLPEEKQSEMLENHPNPMSFAEGFNYDHPTFDAQLNAGLRSLEIDIYYDPTGNRFDDPASYRMLKAQGTTDLLAHNTEGLDAPGFKVLHVADLDFRSHYPTLKGALKELKTWSDAHPKHIPIFILIEAKDSGIPLFQDPTEVLPFDKAAYDALDKELLDVLGREKIITPDDVQEDYKTLKAAVLDKNWPTVDAARGKFIFLLLPGSAGTGTTKTSYLIGGNSLKGRVMFARSNPEDDFAGFMLMDNAIKRQMEIQDYVSLGYLVRTRSDIETYEAKVNDLTRANAAFSSGAQIISTDFYKPGNVYGTDYFVELPDGSIFRRNPVNSEINKE